MLRLEFERRKRNLTQQGLAKKIGIYAPEICKIEQARMKPYDSQAEKLSKFFGILAADLLKEV